MRELNTTSTRTLNECFKRNQNNLRIENLDNIDKLKLTAPCLYLMGEKPTDDLPKNVLLFCQKLRDSLAGEENPYATNNQPKNVLAFFQKPRDSLAGNANPYPTKVGFSLNQAMILNFSSDRYEQSALHPGNLGYNEYLLWNDGGLWGADSWHNERERLLSQFDAQAADNRLAWLGAGWLSSRLSEHIQNNPKPWIHHPDIDTWARKSLETLKQFDTVLINHYHKQEKPEDPPGRKAWNTYLRTLCDFLPYHYSDEEATRVRLPSNSLANKGGPRPWRGLLHDTVTMHVRHLLIEGWLTLWPIVDSNGFEALYLQPGSMALLYWAARQADMPHTASPDDFLNGYDWSNPLWFGGQWHYANPQEP
ncbi:MAG: hypothetical protein HOP34_07740 [Methylococcaceae bacterium]|nr:hypothetical protein [Methylococcaceae bacterium]